MISRRGFLGGLIAAPVIIRLAPLMKIVPVKPLLVRRVDLLTINEITREAVKLWVNSNEFIRSIDLQYDSMFYKEGAKIGNSLRIRLPNDYHVA